MHLKLQPERCIMIKRQGIEMYKLVPKHTIKRIENIDENEELRIMKLTLELAKESDDELWKELVMLHLDDTRILNSEDGERIKRDFNRMLRGI